MNINIELLIISIMFGVGIVYIYSPSPEIIIKYPNENNLSRVVLNCTKVEFHSSPCRSAISHR